MAWKLKEKDIRVIRVNEGLAFIEFDLPKVPTQQVEVGLSPDLPLPRYRIKLRSATIRIRADEELRLTTGSKTLDDLIAKLIVFALCCFVIAELVVALAATLQVAPITWPDLLKLLSLICGSCLLLLDKNTDTIGTLKGEVTNHESWGSWKDGKP
ncbi:MAG: hypothetical protein U0930_20150 [Pirellulales bacterium]